MFSYFHRFYIPFKLPTHIKYLLWSFVWNRNHTLYKNRLILYTRKLKRLQSYYIWSMNLKYLFKTNSHVFLDFQSKENLSFNKLIRIQNFMVRNHRNRKKSCWNQNAFEQRCMVSRRFNENIKIFTQCLLLHIPHCSSYSCGLTIISPRIQTDVCNFNK